MALPDLPWGRFNLYAAGGVATKLCAMLVVVALVVPSLIVVPVSFSEARFISFPPESYSLRWYATYFNHPQWTQATVYSLVLAAITVMVALLIGVPAAFGLVRGRFRGRALVTGLLISPLLIPVVLIAVALFFALTQAGLAGGTIGVVIAHAILALPFVIVVVMASLRDLDRGYEMAALSLGASPLRTFWHVTLPILRPALISAALLAALTSFNEFLVTLFTIGLDRSTLPLQFWKGIRFEQTPTIAAVASLWTMVSILILAVLGFLRWQGERRRPATPP